MKTKTGCYRHLASLLPVVGMRCIFVQHGVDGVEPGKPRRIEGGRRNWGHGQTEETCRRKTCRN